MFARVARYAVAPEKIDEAVESFREAASSLEQLEGMEGGYVLVDADAGTTITLTLWRNQNVMEASETRASILRQKAAQTADGQVQSVERFEVAVEFAGDRAEAAERA